MCLKLVLLSPLPDSLVWKFFSIWRGIDKIRHLHKQYRKLRHQWEEGHVVQSKVLWCSAYFTHWNRWSCAWLDEEVNTPVATNASQAWWHITAQTDVSMTALITMQTEVTMLTWPCRLKSPMGTSLSHCRLKLPWWHYPAVWNYCGDITADQSHHVHWTHHGKITADQSHHADWTHHRNISADQSHHGDKTIQTKLMVTLLQIKFTMQTEVLMVTLSAKSPWTWWHCYIDQTHHGDISSSPKSLWCSKHHHTYTEATMAAQA